VAVERDDRRAVELLLRGGANPARLNSALETTAVHVAAAQNKTDILNMFIGKFCLDPRNDRLGDRVILLHYCTIVLLYNL
jgi:hypothetical protein